MVKSISLVRRLMLILLLASVTISLGMVAIMQHIFQQQIQTTLANKSQVTLDYLAGSLAVPIWDLSDDVVRQIARTAAQDEIIGMIEVTDFSRKKLVYAHQKEAGEHLIQASRVIEHEGFRVGEVRIGLSAQHFDKQLATWITFLLAGASVIIVLSTLLMAALLRRFLRIPFAELTAIVNAYGKGNYASDIVVRYSEFQPFSNVLREMGKQILEQLQKLKDTNAALQADEARLNAMLTELEHARDAAEAANVAKRAFLANMSHEMRTPLNHITGMAGLIRREPLTPKQIDRLGKLENASCNLTAIIDAILELTRIEAGQFALVEESFDLEALLNDVMASVQAQALAKHLHLAAEAAGTPARVLGDGEHIKQALLNYVTNAIRFTEEGAIAIRLKLESKTEEHVLIRFEVEDTGIGIAPEDQSRLFSIFEQVDNSSTRQYGGLGVGLAMTKKVAQIMGGDAGCDSSPGKGSTFWFTVRLKKG